MLDKKIYEKIMGNKFSLIVSGKENESLFVEGVISMLCNEGYKVCCMSLNGGMKVSVLSDSANLAVSSKIGIPNTISLSEQISIHAKNHGKKAFIISNIGSLLNYNRDVDIISFINDLQGQSEENKRIFTFCTRGESNEQLLKDLKMFADSAITID